LALAAVVVKMVVKKCQDRKSEFGKKKQCRKSEFIQKCQEISVQ
jgi:hypothetical protein